jgi:Ni/Fe-hydrogenase subunit HybB-like protein
VRSNINPITFALALLTLLGLTAGVYRLIFGMGPTTNLTDAYPWGLWIGFDFALIAFAGAGFTMATAVYVLRRESVRPAMRPAILAGLLGYLAVLLLLILDLGRWDRFYSFFINWNIHSPLFEISWCIVLYSTVLLVEFSPQLFERLGKERPVRWVYAIVIPLVIAGLTLSSLHQSTLGTLYLNMPHRLHPLWYSPILPLLFFTSSVLAGLSLAIIAYRVGARAAHRPVEANVLDGLAKGVVGAALVYGLLKLGEIVAAGEASLLLAADRYSLLLWTEMLLGVILPIAIFLRPARRHNPAWLWTGALLALFGVLLNRFDATWFAQIGPTWTGYVPHHLEWLSTLGVIAGAMLVWWLGVRYLSVFDSDAHKKYHH